MTRLLLIAIVLGLSSPVMAQSISFESQDDKIEVYKGQKLEIRADTAYVISKNRARTLNQKLEQLVTVSRNERKIYDARENWVKQLEIIEKLAVRLQSDLNRDKLVEEKIEELIVELQIALNALSETNQQLSNTNEQLEFRLLAAKSTIRSLRREVRGIWWNGIADKLVVGSMGVALGFVLASVF